RLVVDQHLDLRALPVEIRLVVADLLHALPRDLLDPGMVDAVGPARFTGDDDLISGNERFDTAPGERVRREVGVDHRIRNPVADLVRMSLGHRLAREEIIALTHSSLDLQSGEVPWPLVAMRFDAHRPRRRLRSGLGSPFQEKVTTRVLR